MNMNIRRIVIMGGGLLILVLLGFWLYTYLSTGTITITTSNSHDYVGIKEVVAGNKKSGYNKQAPHKLTARLHPGQYELTAMNRTIASSKTVTLKARQHISLNINPAAILFTEPVMGRDANSIIADASQMLFIDPSTGYINRVDSSNNMTVLDSSNAFVSAVWADTGFGVAQTKTNQLFSVEAGAVHPLALPFSIDSSAENITYAVSPNHSVYVSNKGDIYMKAPGSDFKKIYTAKHDTVQLTASNNGVTVIYNGVGESGSEGTEATNVKPDLVHIDSGGKVVAELKDVKVYNPVWSRDGNYLGTQQDRGYTIYDKHFKSIVSIPTTDAGGLSWIDGKDFVYIVKNQLWRYSLANNQARKLSQVSMSIERVTVSSDGAYAYSVSLSPLNANAGEVTRTGLKNQQVRDNIQNLDLVLPDTIGGCSINYLNFAHYEIVTTYPSNTSPQDCIGAAKKDLDYYAINPNIFQYSTTPQSTPTAVEAQY